MDDRVLWYPGYADKFVTFGHGQDVKLYKVVRVSQVTIFLAFCVAIILGYHALADYM